MSTARLPGRGLWLTSPPRYSGEGSGQAPVRARGAKAPSSVADGLADRVEALLARRCVDLIGLARRAGQAVTGFAKVEAALDKGEAAVLVEAADGAAGRARQAQARWRPACRWSTR